MHEAPHLQHDLSYLLVTDKRLVMDMLEFVRVMQRKCRGNLLVIVKVT